jgi:prepilin-type N-terminal cleavage/methylation domain-containing protein
LPFEPARRRTEGEAGFTLIELLVVLTVMALLLGRKAHPCENVR